jgi:hypothetical protein
MNADTLLNSWITTIFTILYASVLIFSIFRGIVVSNNEVNRMSSNSKNMNAVQIIEKYAPQILGCSAEEAIKALFYKGSCGNIVNFAEVLLNFSKIDKSKAARDKIVKRITAGQTIDGGSSTIVIYTTKEAVLFFGKTLEELRGNEVKVDAKVTANDRIAELNKKHEEAIGMLKKSNASQEIIDQVTAAHASHVTAVFVQYQKELASDTNEEMVLLKYNREIVEYLYEKLTDDLKAKDMKGHAEIVKTLGERGVLFHEPNKSAANNHLKRLGLAKEYPGVKTLTSATKALVRATSDIKGLEKYIPVIGNKNLIELLNERVKNTKK